MKTIDEKKELALKYANKVKNHIFLQNGTERYYTLIEKDERYFLLSWDGTKKEKKEVSLDHYFKYYPNDPKQMLKYYIFQMDLVGLM